MNPTPSTPPTFPPHVSPLTPLFTPRSIALIGASPKPGSIGRCLAENLVLFDGPTHFINPRHAQILGRPVLPDILHLPGPVDLAVIATPAHTVPGILRDCAQRGVRTAIVLSAGFRECGPAGVALEQQLLAEARPGSIRVLGPNCLGAMSPHHRLNATFARSLARPGNVAFLSQSGALCTAILDWSLQHDVGLSALVSVGAMTDIGWGDLLDHFAHDPHTHAIACYMESVGNARHFLQAARRVAPIKPVFVLKVGRTAAAARAAASHTGSLTGTDAVLDAAFDRAGVLRIESLAELFALVELASRQPPPRGPRLAIVTNAGGPGALATDALVAAGARLAEPSPETLAALNPFLPIHWSHANPVDVLGDADATRYRHAMERMVQDPGTDALLVLLTPQAMTDATAVADAVGALQRPAHLPVFASWMGGAAVAGGIRHLINAGIPAIDHPDLAARAFALLWKHAEQLRSHPPSVPVIPPPASHASTAASLIESVLRAGRRLLTEIESKSLLAAFDIPTVETHAATSADQAVACAGRIGYPVAVKLLSTTVSHKTDVGGVHLDLDHPDAVRKAWHSIQQSQGNSPGFLGVAVQPMIPRDGYELILGSSIDPQFGPVLLFGSGGQLVEILHDTTLELPPLDPAAAQRFMQRTRIHSALLGVRGRHAVDLDALAQILVRFSQLVVAIPRIAEIEINPLLVSGSRLVALDARVLLHPTDVPDALLPRAALLPNP